MENPAKPKRSDELTEREKAILKPYVTDVEAKVFSLRNLNPEVIGAALARGVRKAVAQSRTGT